MIFLISGATTTVEAYRGPLRIGQMVSPCSGNRLNGLPWAADNGAFGAWNEDLFVRMLCRIDCQPNCLFVAAPDVVGDARATFERFGNWRWEIVGRGLPVAMVGQDGAENLDIPWESFDAWFIGGSTSWKLSAASENLAIEAKRRGKWLHMGRVNTRNRLRHAIEIGCDSIDGTGWSRFPADYLRRGERWMRRLSQPNFLTRGSGLRPDT